MSDKVRITLLICITVVACVAMTASCESSKAAANKIHRYGNYDSPTYSQLASNIIGRDITVHCGSWGNNDLGFTYQVGDDTGFTGFQPDIYLRNDICDGLHLLLTYRPTKNSKFFAYDKYDSMGAAILTLQHESDHIILNSGDEGVVECYAIHHVKATLEQYFDMPESMINAVYRNAKEVHNMGGAEYRTVC